MLGADAPLVLDHHEADAPRGGGVELGIVEPAVHVDVGLVVQRPLGSRTGSDGNGHEVDRKQYRDNKKGDGTSHLGATGEFVPENQACKDDKQHSPLNKGISPVNLEKHSCRF